MRSSVVHQVSVFWQFIQDTQAVGEKLERIQKRFQKRFCQKLASVGLVGSQRLLLDIDLFYRPGHQPPILLLRDKELSLCHRGTKREYVLTCVWKLRRVDGFSGEN